MKAVPCRATHKPSENTQENKVMDLKSNAFVGCCGINILWDFGNTVTTPGHTTKFTLKTIKKAITDTLNYGDKRYWYMGRRPPHKDIPKAMTLIALNGTQKRRLHKTLLDKGFKLVSQGYNINHRSLNYLYSLEEEKPE